MIELDNSIRLRKFNYQDIDDLFLIKNNYNTSSCLGGFSNGFSYEDLKKWMDFHSNKNDEILFVIEDTVNSKVIGHVGLYKIDYRIRKADFGILIGDVSYHNRGIGKMTTNAIINYGFKQLNLHKIILSVLEINKPAIGLYKKLGFIEQGFLNDEQFRDGKYLNVLLMAKFNNI